MKAMFKTDQFFHMRLFIFEIQVLAELGLKNRAKGIGPKESGQRNRAKGIGPKESGQRNRAKRISRGVN